MEGEALKGSGEEETTWPKERGTIHETSVFFSNFDGQRVNNSKKLKLGLRDAIFGFDLI